MVYLRGYAKRGTWVVTHSGGSQYLAERFVGNERESHYVSAHCLACAKTEVLTHYGGKVDLRGWHQADGLCGDFLLATQQAVNEGKELDDNS